MGFMDKAKKMAEQAQSKLDEVQKQFNENQTSAPPPSQGPVTEYDKHGRPVTPDAPPPPPPAPEAAAAPHPPTPPAAPPERTDEYAPPKMTSGDPLG
jgi:hypothetical protein